jgi:hypothetical protein
MFTPGARIELGVGYLRQPEAPLQLVACDVLKTARGCNIKGGRYGN